MAPRTENRLTRPEMVTPTRVVEGTYGQAGGGVDTQDGQEKYLKDRFSSREHRRNRRSWVRVPRIVPTRRIKKSAEWAITPFEAGSLTFAGLTLVNLLANASTLGNEVRELVGTGQTQSQTITKPGDAVAVYKDLTTSITFPAGATRIPIETNAAKAFVAQIKEAEKEGFRVERRVNTGSASADWATGITSEEEIVPGNTRYAEQRRDGFASAVDTAAQKAGIHLPAGIDKEEVVAIPKTVVQRLNAALKAAGLPPFAQSFNDILAEYNTSPHSLPSGVRNLLSRYVGGVRSATQEVVMEKIDYRPVHSETITNQVPDNDQLRFIPFGIPFLRKRHIEKGTKRKYTKERIGEDLHDPVWFKLYPKGLLSNSELSPDAALYTRFLQIFMREEGRIPKVLTHTYQDNQGKEQKIHALFMDHEPTVESLKFITNFMVSASMAQDGELAEKLRYISVFQSETAGIDPKNAGLGIDDQEPRSVDGLTVPAVGWVQLHMPKDPTPEQWAGINGAAALWGHEIGGHMNEIDKNKARQVRELDPDRHMYVATGSFIDVIPQEVVERHPDIQTVPPEDLDVTVKRTILDRTGKPIDIWQTVKGDDARIGEGLHTYVENASPTPYGADPSEMHAEVAAAEYAGEISYDVAGMSVTSPAIGEFARGYHPSSELRRIFQKNSGALLTESGVAWNPDKLEERLANTTFSLTNLEDSELYPFAQEARNTPLPPEEELIKVYASTFNKKIL